MVSTFSDLTGPEGHKEERRVGNGGVVKFKYPEVVAGNYRYRGEVDNHNALRHDGGPKPQMFLESSRGTALWPIRVFLFS